MRTHAPAHGLRLRGAPPRVLPPGAVTATAALGGVSPAHAAGSCGVRVDFPHASYTTAHQIHTRAESYCWVFPVQSNQLSAVTYRSRWYGWQRVGSAAY